MSNSFTQFIEKDIYKNGNLKILIYLTVIRLIITDAWVSDITNEESIDDQKTWLNMPLAVGSSFKDKETFTEGFPKGLVE